LPDGAGTEARTLPGDKVQNALTRISCDRRFIELGEVCSKGVYLMGGKSQSGMQQATAHMSVEMENCIQNCDDCHAICTSTLAHCLQMGGEHATHSHIRLLLDCAQICQTSADFMLRGSALHHRTCAVCAEVCDRCAEDCEKYHDDETMRQCAEMCRQCAGSCRSMANM
jgi:hypothetical protein